MISIVISDNPAGKYWAEYDRSDERMMHHLLAGSGWSPRLEDVKDFIKIAKAHGLTIELPKETA